MLIVSVLLIVLGIIMLICGVRYKFIKISSGFSKQKLGNRKSIFSILESITSKRVICKFLNILTHNKVLGTNKLTIKILELSEIGISIQHMYFLKIVCVILCAFVVIAVRYTNINYQVKLIIESSANENAVIYQDNSYDPSRYLLYKQVLRAVNGNRLSNASNTDKYYLVEKEMAEYLNTIDNQLLKEKTEWFLKTWREVHSVRVFSIYHILIILFAMFLPEVFLTLRWLLRGCVYKKEIIKLEYIFALLSQVDGIKTIDIIRELEKSSKIYAKFLNEFALIFQYDKKRGFDYLKNRNIKSLSKLANVLEIYSLKDKGIALQILERVVMERDESIIITADETIDFIDLVAFLSIIPLVYELARFMLSPMLDMVYRAFEFI